ncbi:hypothetical protein ZIOFF_054976 [Zingiber officinale]|uniref:Uncharacterized protein n=1 Tax=Zingiber officinale TaxID=94328 RepID=A0A8J5FEU1_ZINOF|nr:hypothetical protein ZIOFF_054976 [Zingiber officinale]
MLNELASPYGDCEQHLAYAFLQALFCRATASGDHCYNTSLIVAERTVSFASPAASPSSSRRLPRGPLSATSPPTAPSSRPSTALASRADADAPRARLTVVSSTAAGVVAEIGALIEKFARLMGVPLEFRAIAAPALSRLADALCPEKLELREGEAVAVNCVGALQRAGCGDSRDSFLRAAAACSGEGVLLEPRRTAGVRGRRRRSGVAEAIPEGWSLLPAKGETSGIYLTWKDKIENLFDSHY